MQTRIKWRADRGTRALKRLSQIEATIEALGDEDLLDLADIVSGTAASPLNEIAGKEMQRRQISL